MLQEAGMRASLEGSRVVAPKLGATFVSSRQSLVSGAPTEHMPGPLATVAWLHEI